MTHPTIGSTVAHKVPMLHVHAQTGPRDPIIIAGNQAGIMALKAACEKALMLFGSRTRPEYTMTAAVFTCDGEVYAINVTVYTAAEMLQQPLPWCGK